MKLWKLQKRVQRDIAIHVNLIDTLYSKFAAILVLFCFFCKLALLASLSNTKFKTTFNLERGQKGQFAFRPENTKMAAILE